MAIISNFPGGGGGQMAGIIKNYTVGSSAPISTGDFVSLLDGQVVKNDYYIINKGYHQLVAGTNSRVAFSAVALDSTKVLLCFAQDSAQSGTAVIVTFTDDVMTYGTPFVFNSYQTTEICVTKLSTTSALVVYQSSNGKYTAGARVLTISGTTITAGTENTTYNGTGNILYPALAALSATKVLMTFRDVDAYTPAAIVFSITGTTITFGTKLSVLSGYATTQYLCQLSATTAVGFYTETTTRVRIAFFTISGTTITKNSDDTVYEGNAEAMSLVKITNTKFLCFYTANGIAQGKIVTLSGTSFTMNTTSYTVGDLYNMQVIPLSEDKSIGLGYTTEGSKLNLRHILYEHEGLTINAKTVSTLVMPLLHTVRRSVSSAPPFFTAVLINAQVQIFFGDLYAGSTYSFLYATLQSRVLSNVLGVAKTSGVTGETIDVYTAPDISYIP